MTFACEPQHDEAVPQLGQRRRSLDRSPRPALGSMIGGRLQGATRLLQGDIAEAAEIKWERPHDQVQEDDQ
jgi:hypothetical protein